MTACSQVHENDPFLMASNKLRSTGSLEWILKKTLNQNHHTWKLVATQFPLQILQIQC